MGNAIVGRVHRFTILDGEIPVQAGPCERATDRHVQFDISRDTPTAEQALQGPHLCQVLPRQPEPRADASIPHEAPLAVGEGEVDVIEAQPSLGRS